MIELLSGWRWAEGAMNAYCHTQSARRHKDMFFIHFIAFSSAMKLLCFQNDCCKVFEKA